MGKERCSAQVGMPRQMDRLVTNCSTPRGDLHRAVRRCGCCCCRTGGTAQAASLRQEVIGGSAAAHDPTKFRKFRVGCPRRACPRCRARHAVHADAGMWRWRASALAVQQTQGCAFGEDEGEDDDARACGRPTFGRLKVRPRGRGARYYGGPGRAGSTPGLVRHGRRAHRPARLHADQRPRKDVIKSRRRDLDHR